MTEVPPIIPLVTSPPQAQFDLNIYPLVREYEVCCNTYKLSLHLLFRWPSSPTPKYSPMFSHYSSPRFSVKVSNIKPHPCPR